MEWNRKIILTILCFLILGSSWAQVNRYMVFFTDKNNSQYAPAKPEEFLSQRAIERRNRYQIPVTIQDLPVNANYVEALSNMGIDVFHRSRWFNAVLVQMEENMISSVESLATVKKVLFVAPGERLIKSTSLRPLLKTPLFQIKNQE